MKKLKYLKNPRIPIFTTIEVISNPFLNKSLFFWLNKYPIEKSIAELKTIKDKNRQSHQP